jgi:hypothetical protein
MDQNNVYTCTKNVNHITEYMNTYIQKTSTDTIYIGLYIYIYIYETSMVSTINVCFGQAKTD